MINKSLLYNHMGVIDR